MRPPYRKHRGSCDRSCPRGTQLFSLDSFTACRTTNPWRRKVGGTTLAMEGLALTGAQTDPGRGLISTDRSRNGRLIRLCALRLRAGEPVILMGPTGAPTETSGGDQSLSARRRRFGQRGAGFHWNRAARSHGSKVVLFRWIQDALRDRYKVEEIEARRGYDHMDAATMPLGFAPRRPQDQALLSAISLKR